MPVQLSVGIDRAAGGLAQGIHSLDHIRGPLPSTLRAQRGRDEGGKGESRQWRREARR